MYTPPHGQCKHPPTYLAKVVATGGRDGVGEDDLAQLAYEFLKSFLCLTYLCIHIQGVQDIHTSFIITGIRAHHSCTCACMYHRASHATHPTRQHHMNPHTTVIMVFAHSVECLSSHTQTPLFPCTHPPPHLAALLPLPPPSTTGALTHRWCPSPPPRALLFLPPPPGVFPHFKDRSLGLFEFLQCLCWELEIRLVTSLCVMGVLMVGVWMVGVLMRGVM